MANNSEGIMARYKKYLTNQQKKKLRSLYAGYQQTTADERREAYLQARRAADRSAAAASSMGLGGGYEARKQAATNAELDKYGLQLNRQADAAFESNAVVPMANATIKAQNEAARKAYERKKRAAQRAYQDALNKQKQQQTARLTKQERDRLKYYRYGQQYMDDALMPNATAYQNAPKTTQTTNPRYNTHNRDKAYQYAQEWVDDAGATRPKTKRERDRAKANRYAQDWAGNAPKESPLKKNNGSAVNPRFDISPKRPVILPPETLKTIDLKAKDILAMPPAELERNKAEITRNYLNTAAAHERDVSRLYELAAPLSQAQNYASRYRELEAMVKDTSYSPEQRRGFTQEMSGLQRLYAQAMSQNRINSQEFSELQRRVLQNWSILQEQRALLGAIGVEMDEDDAAFKINALMNGKAVPMVDNKEFWDYADKVKIHFDNDGKISVINYGDEATHQWLKDNGYDYFADQLINQYGKSDVMGNEVKTLAEVLDPDNADRASYFSERERYQYMKSHGLNLEQNADYGQLMPNEQFVENDRILYDAVGEKGLLNGLFADPQLTLLYTRKGNQGEMLNNAYTEAYYAARDEAEKGIRGEATMRAQEYDYLAELIREGKKAEATQLAIALLTEESTKRANKYYDKMSPGMQWLDMAINTLENTERKDFETFTNKIAYNDADIYNSAQGQKFTERLMKHGKTEKEKKRLEFIGSTFVSAVQSSIDNIPARALSPLPGGQVISKAKFFSQAFGHAKHEALGKGKDLSSANVYALVVGACEVGLESLLGGIPLGGKSTVGKALEKAVGKIPNALLRTIASVGVDAFGEFTEESLQEILDPVWGNLFLGEHNEFKPFTEQTLQAGLSGALSAVLGGAPQTAIATLNKTATVSSLMKAGLSRSDAEFYLSMMERVESSENISDKDLWTYLSLQDALLHEGLKSGDKKVNIHKNLGELYDSRKANKTETLDATDHTAELANLKGKAKARYLIDASPTGKVGDLYFTTTDGKAMDVKNMGLTQKTNFNIAQKLAKAFPNIKIVAHDNLYGIDGVNHVVEGQSPEIHVSLNGSAMVMTTAAHELLHQVEKTDAKAYKNIQTYLTTLLDESEIATTEKNVASKYGIEYTVDEKGNKVFKDEKARKTFESEVAAHLAEKVLTDDSFLDRIIRDSDPKNRTTKAKLINGLKDVIDRVAKALRGEPTVSGKLYKLQRTIEKAYREMSKADLTATKTETEEADFEAVEKNEKQKEEAVKEATEKVEEMPTIEEASTEEIEKNPGISFLGNRDTLGKTMDKNMEPMFRVSDWNADEDAYREMATRFNLFGSKAKTDEFFNMMRRVADNIALQTEKGVKSLDYSISEDESMSDFHPEDWYDGDERTYSPVKPNSDPLYKWSIDFSTLCRKRLLQQAVQKRLEAHLKRNLSFDEQNAIRNALKNLQSEGKKIEVACALCYVEAARFRSPKQISRFMSDRQGFLLKQIQDKALADEFKAVREEVKEKYGVSDMKALRKNAKAKAEFTDRIDELRDNYKPTVKEQALLDAVNDYDVTDFTTPAGLEKLARENRELYDAYTTFIRQATKSKALETSTPWRVGDSEKISDAEFQAFNSENGLRSNSWSDFQVMHLLDYISSIIELSTRNAKMQAYTKVANYARLMGDTGVMINLSLIPTAKYAKGSKMDSVSDYDSVEGMDYTLALQLRKEHANTVGTICIATNDEQLEALCANPNVDMVIPYHDSGMSKANRKKMGIPDWQSYQKVQSDKEVTLPKEAQTEDYHKPIKFSDWFDYDEAVKTAKKKGAFAAMEEAARKYLDLCKERGYTPKFADYTKVKGYWKLLTDRKMINQETGEIIKQEAVKPIFDEGTINSIIKEEVDNYAEFSKDFDAASDAVFEQFKDGNFKTTAEDKRLADSVNNAYISAVMGDDMMRVSDTEYLSLAEKYRDGTATEEEKAELEKRVEEAARKAGYNSPKLYHGTPFYGFTEINTEKSNDKRTFYVTSSIDTAGTYSGTDSVRAISDTSDDSKRGIYQFYANTDGMLELDANGEGSGHIALGKIEKAFNYDSSNKAWRSFATMRQIADFAKRNGYAGVIVRNVVDSATTESRQKIPATDVYGFFNPKERLKSADLITRDDDGNIIPPSQRFNDANDDIRYRISDYSEDEAIVGTPIDAAAVRRAVKTGKEQTTKDGYTVKVSQGEGNKYTVTVSRDGEVINTREGVANEELKGADIERTAAALMRNIKKGRKERQYSDEGVNAQGKNYANQREADARLAERMHEGAITAKVKRLAGETEEQYKARIKKIYEDKIRRETKETALKYNKKLVKMLANPTEKQHVPVQLAQSVAEFCEAVTSYLDGHTKRGQKMLEKIGKAYERAFSDAETIERAKSEDEAYALPSVGTKNEQLVEMIEALADITAEKSFSELNREEMTALLNVVRGVTHAVSEANKLIGEAKGKTVYEAGKKLIEEMETAPKIPNKLRSYLETSLDLRRLARIFSGSNDNAEFVKLVDQLNEGAIEKERISQELQAIFKPVTDKYGKEIRKWYGKNAEWIDAGVDKNGVIFKITKGMRVSLALHVLNEGNMRHIERGGLTIPEAKLYAQGKLADAYAHGTKVRLSAEQINKILTGMTEAEKAYVEAAKELFHDQAGFYVNKTSLQLLGYTLANVENYFPIHTNKNYTATDFVSMVMNGSLEGQGFLQERKMGTNPIYLEDITDVVNRQIRGVALYAGLAIPVRNFNAVTGTTLWSEDSDGTWTPDTSVKEVIEKNMGNYGYKVVKGFVEDVSEMGARVDVTPVERIAGKLATNYVKAVLLGNLKVAMKQVASYPTAAAVIPWKYLNKALLAGGRKRRIISRADVDLINKYTPLYKMRQEGNANEIASITNKPGMEQKLPWLLGWITKMDVMTVGRLWSAAEYMVEDQHRELTKGTDEFYREVAKVFNQTIQQTQPNFTPLQRSAALRSKNPIVRSLTLFGTQRMQNGGILIEAAMELKQSKGKSKEEIAAARAKLGRAVASQVVQNVLLIAATFAVDALRGRMRGWQDDDDELTLESIASKMGDTFLSNFLGSFLGGSEFYELVSNIYKKANGQTTYDTEFSVPALDAIETILKFGESGIPNFIKYLSGDHTDEEKLNKMKSFSMELAKVAGYATGLPLENAVKDLFKGILPAIQDIRDYKKSNELIPWLRQSGKLDSATTRRRYEEWIDGGRKGSQFFALDKKLKGASGGRDGRAEILREMNDLAPEDKAFLMEMYDNSEGYAEGSKFFNKNGKELYDFAAEPAPEAEAPDEVSEETPEAVPAEPEAEATPDPFTEATNTVKKMNAEESVAYLNATSFTSEEKYQILANADKNDPRAKNAQAFHSTYGLSYDDMWDVHTKYNSETFHGYDFQKYVDGKKGLKGRQKFALVELANTQSAWLEKAQSINSKMGISYDTLWKIKFYWSGESGQGKKARITAYCKSFGLKQSQIDKLYNEYKFLS